MRTSPGGRSACVNSWTRAVKSFSVLLTTKARNVADMYIVPSYCFTAFYPGSQLYACFSYRFTVLLQHCYGEVRDSWWTNKHHLARNIPCVRIKCIGQRAIDRRAKNSVDDQAHVIIAITRNDIDTALVIHSKIEDIELLPRFALHPVIRVADIHAGQMEKELETSIAKVIERIRDIKVLR